MTLKASSFSDSHILAVDPLSRGEELERVVMPSRLIPLEVLLEKTPAIGLGAIQPRSLHRLGRRP